MGEKAFDKLLHKAPVMLELATVLLQKEQFLDNSSILCDHQEITARIVASLVHLLKIFTHFEPKPLKSTNRSKRSHVQREITVEVGEFLLNSVKDPLCCWDGDVLGGGDVDKQKKDERDHFGSGLKDQRTPWLLKAHRIVIHPDGGYYFGADRGITRDNLVFIG